MPVAVYHVRVNRSPQDGEASVRGEADAFLLLDDAALIHQCDVDCFRSSGPGGQKRNKTSSAVRLRHRPTGLSATGVEDRSQHVNKARALRRLRLVIALNVRTTFDVAIYVPSERLDSCRSGNGGLKVGRRDVRYPLAVAEVLDVLGARSCRVSEAAKAIGVSTANLVKFFEGDPKLWARVNQMRAEVGAKPLRSG